MECDGHCSEILPLAPAARGGLVLAYQSTSRSISLSSDQQMCRDHCCFLFSSSFSVSSNTVVVNTKAAYGIARAQRSHHDTAMLKRIFAVGPIGV